MIAAFAFTFISTAIIAFVVCSVAALLIGLASEHICQGIDE